jgi:hypothetical protein
MFPIVYEKDYIGIVMIDDGGITRFEEQYIEGSKLAILNNLIEESALLRQTLNGECTFAFEAHEKELKSAYINTSNKILIKGQFFDIKYLEKSHSTDVLYAVECEHVSYRLHDGEQNTLESYAYTGTPTEILENILEGTEFEAGLVEFSEVTTVSVNAKVTKRELVKQLANLLKGQIKYSNNGFSINITNTINENKGFEARFGKNLIGITKTIDARGGKKIYYGVDLLVLKNSNEYIKKDLQDLEILEIGNQIRVVDKIINEDVKQTVVAIESNPIFEINTKLEITNRVELITDKINEIATTAVIRDTLYNNCAISTEYGFRSELSNKMARATLGGGALSLDVGDGIGNYSPALSFDVLKGKFLYVGDIEASGKITGAEFIGGNINIGSGTFAVDELGNAIANSISIGGGSGIANFSDAGALATKDNVNMGEVLGAGDLAYLDSISGTHIDNNSISTPKIATGAVDASKINVASLSAISANIGTITTGDLTGVNISANTFNADDYVYINTNNYNEGLYLSGFGNMYFRVYDPGGTVEVGPHVRIPGSLSVGGGISSDGSILATQDWVGLQGFVQASYVNNYAVRDLSSQGIEMQIFNDYLEVRQAGGSWKVLPFA